MSDDSTDTAAFMLRALEYFSTGKDEEAETDWLAGAIQKDEKLLDVLARIWAEATNNAVGEAEIKRVFKRMQLITAKSCGIPKQWLPSDNTGNGKSRPGGPGDE